MHKVPSAVPAALLALTVATSSAEAAAGTAILVPQFAPGQTDGTVLHPERGRQGGLQPGAR